MKRKKREFKELAIILAVILLIGGAVTAPLWFPRTPHGSLGHVHHGHAQLR